MKQEINIADLIKKFNEGTVSKAELTLLVSHFKGHEPESELLAFYQKTWYNASVINNTIDSPKIYGSILKEIDYNDRGLTQMSKSRRNIIVLNTLKYAAIFIFGFGISWLINYKPASLQTDNNIYGYQTIEVPYGSRIKLELPDGSKVVLNSGSKLRYKTLFEKNSRTVFLEGEAYFDVKKDKDNPFYVNTSGIKIKVLGTSFNIKAYPDEKIIETTVITGAIGIYDSKKNVNTPVTILKPKQKAFYSKETSEITKKEEEKTANVEEIPLKTISIENLEEIELTTAWKDDNFIFNNERFSDLVIKIERWYNVEIELRYPALNEVRFSGRFDKETVEQAMKALTYVTPFHFEIKKNKIYIYK